MISFIHSVVHTGVHIIMHENASFLDVATGILCPNLAQSRLFEEFKSNPNIFIK